MRKFNDDPEENEELEESSTGGGPNEAPPNSWSFSLTKALDSLGLFLSSDNVYLISEIDLDPFGSCLLDADAMAPSRDFHRGTTQLVLDKAKHVCSAGEMVCVFHSGVYWTHHTHLITLLSFTKILEKSSLSGSFPRLQRMAYIWVLVICVFDRPLHCDSYNDHHISCPLWKIRSQAKELDYFRKWRKSFSSQSRHCSWFVALG